VWQPSAWFHGTLTPLLDPLVADGQGVVSLALHGVTGGVNLSLLTVSCALAYVAVVVAFAAFYPTLKRIWPLLLPAVFFFSARSLSSYLVNLFPVAVIAAATVTAAVPASPRRSGLRRSMGPTALAPTARVSATGGRALLVALLTTGAVALSVLALTSSPLQLTVRAVTTSHGGRTVDTVTVGVRNRTGAAVTPHFLVNTGDNPNGFWLVADGRPTVVGPHQEATLTLHAPVSTTAPQKGASWLVEAYTSSPRALSTSPRVLWRLP
jgi:hypothetical protein